MVNIIDDLSEYEEYYNSKIIAVPHTPFQTFCWAKFHVAYFKDRFYFLYLEENNDFVAGLVLFELSTPYGKMFYSYGRFGTAGLLINRDKNCQNALSVVSIFKEKILREIEPNPSSISIGNLQIGYYDEDEIKDFKTFCNKNNGIYYYKINQIVDLKKFIEDDKNFGVVGNSLIPGRSRRNILRNIRHARENSIIISDEVTLAIIKGWHEIHLKRIQELHGKPWPLQFFITALEVNRLGPLKFFGAYQHEKLVGGVICFYNKHILDIFVMSTSKKFLSCGTNHSLSQHIYKWCAKNGIYYINWQASNPPDSGIAKFKKQWMAENYIMHSINLSDSIGKSEAIDNKELMQKYPDRFLFPFT